MHVREHNGGRSDAVIEGSHRAVLVAAVLGTALAYMSDDMLNLAIPSVARDLQATAAGVQWILNAYYIPLVAVVLVAGSMGDILGHRRVFTAGLLLFSVGAVLCASAPHVGLLIAGRALQGLAAAMLRCRPSRRSRCRRRPARAAAVRGAHRCARRGGAC